MTHEGVRSLGSPLYLWTPPGIFVFFQFLKKMDFDPPLSPPLENASTQGEQVPQQV